MQRGHTHGAALTARGDSANLGTVVGKRGDRSCATRTSTPSDSKQQTCAPLPHPPCPRTDGKHTLLCRAARQRIEHVEEHKGGEGHGGVTVRHDTIRHFVPGKEGGWGKAGKGGGQSAPCTETKGRAGARRAGYRQNMEPAPCPFDAVARHTHSRLHPATSAAAPMPPASRRTTHRGAYQNTNRVPVTMSDALERTRTSSCCVMMGSRVRRGGRRMTSWSTGSTPRLDGDNNEAAREGGGGFRGGRHARALSARPLKPVQVSAGSCGVCVGGGGKGCVLPLRGWTVHNNVDPQNLHGVQGRLQAEAG